jgi:hypothetical protein
MAERPSIEVIAAARDALANGADLPHTVAVAVLDFIASHEAGLAEAAEIIAEAKRMRDAMRIVSYDTVEGELRRIRDFDVLGVAERDCFAQATWEDDCVEGRGRTLMEAVDKLWAELKRLGHVREIERGPRG